MSESSLVDEVFIARASELIVPSRYSILDQKGFWVDIVEYLHGVKSEFAFLFAVDSVKRLEPKVMDTKIKKIINAELNAPRQVRDMIAIDKFLALIWRGYSPAVAQKIIEDMSEGAQGILNNSTPRRKPLKTRLCLNITSEVHKLFAKHVDPDKRQTRQIFTRLIEDVFTLLDFGEEVAVEYWVRQVLGDKKARAKSL